VSESLAYLGLRADADERAVKRAYAQRLKQIRPEDDPAGFQTLHEHYRIALEQARQRAETTTPDVSSAEAASAMQWSSEAADPPKPDVAAAAVVESSSIATPEESAPLPLFDLEAFLQTLLAKIGDDDPEKLRDWLQSIDAFWSIAVKNQAGHAALHKLANEQVAMRAELFEVLLAYFDLDNALSGYDHVGITRLRDALQLRYELMDAHRGDLTQRMRIEGGFDPSQTRTMVNALLRPFELWRDYVSALLPGRPTSMVRFIHVLSRGQPGLLCPLVDPQHLQFWYGAVDRGRFMRPRVALGYLRIVTMVVSAAAILCALTLALPPTPSKRYELTASTLNFFGWTLAGLIALWSAWLVWLVALRWQTGPEDGRLDRNGIGRTLFIPTVAAAAAVVCVYSPYVWLLNLGLAAATVVAALAVVRFWRRAGLRFPKIHFGGLAWVVLVVAGNFSRVLFEQGSRTSPDYTGALVPDGEEWQARAFIGIVFACVAGFAWFVDLARQWRVFHRPQTATGR